MTDDIEIIIERLQLRGIDPADRDAIAEAIRVELAHLVKERGVPASWQGGAAAPVQVEVRAGDAPERIGAHVARAVYGGSQS